MRCQDRKPLNTNRIAEQLRFDGVFCDTLLQTARKSLILKRRDVPVVEGARLENDSDEPHRAIPKHPFAQSIQRLPAAECLLM